MLCKNNLLNSTSQLRGRVVAILNYPNNSKTNLSLADNLNNYESHVGREAHINEIHRPLPPELTPAFFYFFSTTPQNPPCPAGAKIEEV